MEGTVYDLPAPGIRGWPAGGRKSEKESIHRATRRPWEMRNHSGGGVKAGTDVNRDSFNGREVGCDGGRR